MRLKYLFGALVLLGTTLNLAASDREIALVYQEQISEHFNIEPDISAELLEKAFTFSQELSGLWYFQGQIYQRDDRLVEAHEAYTKALLLDDWEGSLYDSFLNTIMILLERMGKWEEILQVQKTIGFHRVNFSQVLLSTGWAHYNLDQFDHALRVAEKGRQLYPENPHFYTLSLACESEPKVIESFLFYFGNQNMTLYNTVYRLFKVGKLPSQLRDHYVETTSDSFGVYLQLVENLDRDKKDNTQRVSRFLEENVFTDLGLLIKLSDLCDQEGKTLLDEYILQSEVNFYLDRDGDFHPEVIYTDERILLFDRDRDGNYETEMTLSPEGFPQIWQSEGGNLSQREITFHQWPYVDQVTMDYGSSIQKFHFLYPYLNLVDYKIPQKPTLFSLVETLLPQDLNLPFESLLAFSTMIEETMEGRPFRFSYVVNGQIIGISEDSNGDGMYNRQILLEEGEISAARRDLDNDGDYDLFEYYQQGIWEGFAINLNGGTWSDFYEDWSILSIKMWDFKGDQLINGYSIGSSGGTEKIIRPQVKDVIEVEQLLYWEKKFEAQWYR